MPDQDVPDVWWSAAEHALYAHLADADPDQLAMIPLSEDEPSRVDPSAHPALPADAVRLVPTTDTCGEVFTEGLLSGTLGPCIRTGEHTTHTDDCGQSWTPLREPAGEVPEPAVDVSALCDDMGGPSGVSGPCALPAGHELHRDGIGGEWAGAVPDTGHPTVNVAALLALAERASAVPDTGHRPPDLDQAVAACTKVLPVLDKASVPVLDPDALQAVLDAIAAASPSGDTGHTPDVARAERAVLDAAHAYYDSTGPSRGDDAEDALLDAVSALRALLGQSARTEEHPDDH